MEARALTDLVRRGTRVLPVPLVPEVRLHLADEPCALWEETERAQGRDGLDPPFWAFAWAGGQAVARYVLDHPDVVQGRHVLDVGAGSGLVAIAAAIAGAATVTAVDVDPFAVAAVAANARLNDAAVAAVCADILDGHYRLPGAGASKSVMPGTGGAADVVLAGDVCYQRALATRAVAFLRGAAATGAHVLLGDPGRAYVPTERVAVVASHDVPVDRELESADVKFTRVLRIDP